jgi:hypothetical protein
VVSGKEAARVDDLLWFHGREEEWKHLVEVGYWQAVRPDHLEVEREMEHLDREGVRRMSPPDFYRWLHDRYFFWKYTQANRLATTRRTLEQGAAADPGLARLAAVHRRLFAVRPDRVQEALRVATAIPGLGVAGASGLLALLFPEWFGTVDQFVVAALHNVRDLPEHAMIDALYDRVVERGRTLKEEDGARLIRIMQRQAAALNTRFQSTYWTPRKVDMALWGDRTARLGLTFRPPQVRAPSESERFS